MVKSDVKKYHHSYSLLNSIRFIIKSHLKLSRRSQAYTSHSPHYGIRTLHLRPFTIDSLLVRPSSITIYNSDQIQIFFMPPSPYFPLISAPSPTSPPYPNPHSHFLASRCSRECKKTQRQLLLCSLNSATRWAAYLRTAISRKPKAKIPNPKV